MNVSTNCKPNNARRRRKLSFSRTEDERSTSESDNDSTSTDEFHEEDNFCLACSGRIMT